MATGAVVSLYVCAGHRAPMDARDSVTVTATGIEGDRYAIANSHRQVLLMESEILDSLSLAHGEIRENVTISGLPIHHLTAGERLRLGADVVLEVTELCAPCGRMDQIRPGLQQTLDGRRGVLTRVVSGGDVSVGDTIEQVG